MNLIWVSPHAVVDSAADPTFRSLCDCLDPGNPRLLPDTSDFAAQVEMRTSFAHDTWCSMMTDYSSHDRLQRAFDEANFEAQTYFDLNLQLLEDMAEFQRQAIAEIVQLRSDQ